MSTRATVIITDGDEKLYFYRHSDGYPDGVMPTLNIFMKWLKEGAIRDNTQQAAGWLILLGAMEYNTIPNYKNESNYSIDPSLIEEPKDWKASAYEPTTSMNDWAEHLYTIDLSKKTLTHREL